ncbi:MAG TPA: GNAT family N-acetyltransferase [Candidatus Binataceae bacterium]
MRHPEHDRIRSELEALYRNSFPEVGIQVEQRRFGFYRCNLHSPETGRILVRDLSPGEVPGFIADARSYFPGRALEIWLDDSRLELALGPALSAAGCVRQAAVVYLAHVGAIARSHSTTGVTVEPVTAATMSEFATVKLKGFANSENEPAPEPLAQEVAVRTSESRGAGRFLLARVGAEPAAIAGYYDGPDRLIFNLATRIPYRGRGIARQLLCQVLADGDDTGGRSVIINTNPDDTPIQWYRRLGFTDEVYWHRNYSYGPRD